MSLVQSSELENLKLVGTVQDDTEGADQTIIHPLRSLSSESKSDINIPVMVILLNQIRNIKLLLKTFLTIRVFLKIFVLKNLVFLRHPLRPLRPLFVP